MWMPDVLRPAPDKFYESELKRIDPDLRLVWGYDRYLQNRWVVERKIPYDRYAAMYHTSIDTGEERFIDQPVFDDDKPIYDEAGEVIGSEQVGTRKFDLRPEWECVLIVENDEGEYRPMDMHAVIEVKRAYAWDRFTSLEKLKLEGDAEREGKENKLKEERIDAAMDEFKSHRRELYNLPFTGQVGGFA
jgi:hypothetical protein